MVGGFLFYHKHYIYLYELWGHITFMEIQASILYHKIHEAVSNEVRLISLRGSSRSGKSYQIIIYLILYAIQHENTTITIVRDTLVSIRNSILIDFINVMNEMGFYNPEQFNKSEVIYKFGNGSMVRFLGADDNSAKLRGMKQDITFINEITSVSLEAFTQLNMRTTKFIIADYNPTAQDGWYWYDLEEGDNAQLIISTYKENPFLEQRVIDAIEGLKELDPEMYEVYALGKKIKPRETIFVNWEVVKEPPRYSKFLGIGLDWGYSQDECACVYGVINEPDNIIYLKEVFYEKGLLIDDIAYKLDEGGVHKNFDIVCDSSEPRMLEELKKRGFKKVIPVKKEAGSVLFGINEMKRWKIQIDESSINLIDEIKNYRWGKDRSGNITSKPTGRDHLLDASRYLITQMAYKPKTKYSFV